MSIRWRWDQGRTEYFSFAGLRAIASSLVKLDGFDLRNKVAFRQQLEEMTGFPYSPHSRGYESPWRNYGRVFKAALLATDINHNLITTDVCKRMSGAGDKHLGVDEYLSFLIPRFYFPCPAYNDYRHDCDRVFPVCAVLRYLIATFQQRGEAYISLEGIFKKVVGNQVAGTENLDYFLSLSDSSYSPSKDEPRQVREMLIFFSQFSFLKWHGDTIFLDIDGKESGLLQWLKEIATPIIRSRNSENSAEIIALGMIPGTWEFELDSASRETPADKLFTEGKRTRASHLRIERSPKLRKAYLEALAAPMLCEACAVDVKQRYPWTDNLLEIHHLLPLSSPFAITPAGTSLDDLTAICPNCHRAVHVYYRGWLNRKQLDDFRSHDEARGVFEEVRQKIEVGGYS